jgi:hypothetical protein
VRGSFDQAVDVVVGAAVEGWRLSRHANDRDERGGSMSDLEIRFQRLMRIALELHQALQACSDAGEKLSIISSIQKGLGPDASPSAKSSTTAESVRVFRNCSDDFIRVGSLLRRSADLMEPIVEEMRNTK